MACCETRKRAEHTREEYSRPVSEAARRLERELYGREVGSSGYTTVAQADRLAAYLSLKRRDAVLDLGSGRGWPGWYLAETTGCALVATDIPVEALRSARERLEPSRVRTDAHTVSGDARALPFASGAFDAVTHSDLLCCVPDKLAVLRECHRVLRHGGRIGGYLIHTPPGLSDAGRERAAELGPSAVVGPAAPARLLEAAGFTLLVEEDVTAEFTDLVRATLRIRTALEAELRSEEGSEVYEEEWNRKRSMLEGIEEGLLVRSALAARKPAC